MIWKLLLLSVLTLSTSCAGKPGRCTETGESGFGTFLDDEWRAYCDEYTNYTEDSEAYPLLEVTEFVVSHEERSGELRNRLASFNNVDACFKSGKDELEYRRLNACLRNDAESQLQLVSAWKTAIEPFLEDLKLTVQSTRPRIAEAEKTGKYLLTKAEEALRFSKRTDKKRLDEFQELLSVTSNDVGRLADSVDDYDKVLKAAEDDEELVAELEKEVDEVVKSLRSDIENQGDTIATLRDLLGYLQIVEDTAGKSCPTVGLAQRKETKIAIGELRSYFEKVESGRIRIDEKIEKSKKDGKTVETFGGYTCGLRKDEDQFPNTARLCTIHRFELQRTKDGRRWDDWEITLQQEGDFEEGIDCKKTN